MEFFDITDDNGIPTGKTISRSEAHDKGIPHRTAHIWIVRKVCDGYQVLLQKRSAEKESFPGMYDTSSAGHIPAGCEPLESAIRELHEELGIEAAPENLHYAGAFHAEYALPFHGQMFRDNEFVSVYVYDKSVEMDDIRIQEDEIEKVEWFDLQEVYQECSQRIRTRFCVPLDGLNILVTYLGKGRQNRF